MLALFSRYNCPTTQKCSIYIFPQRPNLISADCLNPESPVEMYKIQQQKIGNKIMSQPSITCRGMATAGSTGGNNLMTYHEFIAAEQLQQQQATEGEIFELKVCLVVPID